MSARTRLFLVAAACLAMAGIAWAAEPSPSKAPRLPVRIHIAHGLWWDHWRLHEAIGAIGGAQCEASWDVFGSTHGYSGCGWALSDFPMTAESLAGTDLIILTGIRASVLPTDAQKRLCAWVEAGGGLLVVGGVHGFGEGGWHGTPLEAILPVEVGGKPDFACAGSPLVMEPTVAGTAVLGKDLAWAQKPSVYYFHENTTPRSDAEVWITGGGKPILLGRQAGKGRVAVCVGTVCGEAAAGQGCPFWEWEDWPKALGRTLKWLVPPASIQADRIAPPMGDPNDPRLKELASLAKLDVQGLLDPPSGKAVPDRSKPAGGFARLQKLASPCGGVLHARAVVKALSESAMPFKAEAAEPLFAAIAPYVQGTEFEAPALTMTQSGNAGQMAFGLRVLGRVRSPRLRTVAAPIILKGIDGLSPGGDSTAGAIMRPPDGENEALRLAAIRAALDDGDPELLSALKTIAAPPEAAQNGWTLDGATGGISMGDGRLAIDRVIALEALAARAVLGDTEAAPGLVRAAIRHRLEFEALLDATQHTIHGVITPAEAARHARQAESLAPRHALANRLGAMVARLPASSYPAVAAWANEMAAAARKPGMAYPIQYALAAEGSSEIAVDALMAAFADRGEPLSPAGVEALNQVAAQTPMPAIRILCAHRVATAKAGR